MNEDPTEAEIIAVATAVVIRDVPQPEKPTPPSERGLARLRDHGLSILADRLEAKGVGEVAKGRLMLASPDLADPVLRSLGLVAEDDVPLTLTYTPFGDVTIRTMAGHDILIMTTGGVIHVYEGEPDEPLFTQMNLAGIIAGAVDLARPHGDHLQDLDGKNLLQAVRKRLGPLAHGQVYALPPDPEDETRFTSGRATVSDLVTYLLDLHAAAPFEIMRMPFIDPGGIDEA